MTKMPYVELNDSRIFYEYLKKKDIPLVFIHGWAGDHTKWSKQLDFFSNKFSTLIYDLEGHGYSSSAKGYSIKHYSESLFHLLEKLTISKIVLIGHSMGGMIAQQFAIDFPNLIDKLVLISTSSKIITSFRKRLAVLLMRFLLRISFNKSLKILVSYTQNPNRTPEELEKLIDHVKKISRKVVQKTFREMTIYNASQKLITFDKPSLIIVGRYDPIISLQMVQNLQKNLPRGLLTIIESGYHEIMLENADEVNQLILDFIEE